MSTPPDRIDYNDPLLSVCCGAPPFGEAHYDGEYVTGRCSDCKDLTTFEPEDFEEPQTTTHS